MAAVHLGIDVGGTASRWVACDEAGVIVARGKAPGATGHVFNPTERENLHASLSTIATDLVHANLAAISVTAGLTGFGAAVAVEVKSLLGSVFGSEPDNIIVTDDIMLAYMANFAPGEGHLVSAGTGSIGIHVAADDGLVRVGGRGILIDDAGSGSWIALQALDAIYRVLDHSGSFASVSALARHLFSEIGGEDWHDVRQFVYTGNRGRIGTLAVAVARAAEEGDAVAISILRRAAGELAQLAQALIARVGSRPIGLTGGVLGLHPLITTEIKRHLAGHEVRLANADASLAAARLQAGMSQAWRRLLTEGSSIG